MLRCTENVIRYKIGLELGRRTRQRAEASRIMGINLLKLAQAAQAGETGGCRSPPRAVANLFAEESHAQRILDVFTARLTAAVTRTGS
jgi:hypothetical protein